MKKFAILVAMGTLLGTAAFAQQEKQGVGISIQVLTEKEIEDTSGNKVLQRVPLDVARPDQNIIYKISVENKERETVSNVALNIPVSDSLLIDPKSFTSDIDMSVSFSVDQKLFGSFDKLYVNDNGEKREATPGDITALRIDIPELPKNETYFIEYDAVVR
jgi:hypothetical protein